jgi:hypothetical protein
MQRVEPSSLVKEFEVEMAVQAYREAVSATAVILIGSIRFT